MSLTPEQQKNAAIIREVGKKLGASDRDILIAIMTAMQESSLKNINYGDRDSIGLFQQRRPWGTDAQRMDPYESARMFFEGGHTGQPGLFSKKNRDQMSLTQAAQAVQVSAYPDAYAKHEAAAREFLQMGGNVSGGGPTGGGGGDVSTPRDSLSWKEMAEEYGWNAAYVKANPSLKQLFDEASKNGYDEAEFEARLTNTDWYRDHSSAWRKAKRMQSQEPETWKSEVEGQTQKILDAAAAVGAPMSAATARKIASNALTYGWNEAQIQNTVGGYVNEMKNSQHFGGQAGESEMEIRKMLADNGIKMTQSTIAKWVGDIAVGNKTTKDVEGWIRTQAELNFPAYEKQIKAGMSVREIASTYTQSMADLLEVDADTIDLNDKMLRSALTARNQKGEPVPMSLTDFERTVRQDPRWRKTANARQSAASMANQVLSDFGFRS